MKNKLSPSGRPLREVFESMEKEFFEANGYHPTEEDAISLTEEARLESQLEKELRKKEN